MFEPLVSIVMPAYNAEKYIAEAIESVINQTYKNWELIIVNDGSTDGSSLVAESFECENIKVFAQLNRGASAARNYGLKGAKGEYIQFLDADDVLSTNKIAEHVHLLNQNPGKIAYCSTVHFFDGEDYLSKEIIHDRFHVHHDSPLEFMINLYGGYSDPGGMIQPNTWLTPKSVIEKAGLWDEDLHPNPDDDGEFFCRVVLNSLGVVYADNAVNFYRKYKTQNSLSGKRSYVAMENMLKSAISKKEQLLKRTGDPYAKKALARLFKDIEFMSYPRYRKLSSIARENVQSLGGTDYVPVFGRKISNNIKNLIGWKFTKIIQHIWHLAL